jgi:hypothetical protein
MKALKPGFSRLGTARPRGFIVHNALILQLLTHTFSKGTAKAACDCYPRGMQRVKIGIGIFVPETWYARSLTCDKGHTCAGARRCIATSGNTVRPVRFSSKIPSTRTGVQSFTFAQKLDSVEVQSSLSSSGLQRSTGPKRSGPLAFCRSATSSKFQALLCRRNRHVEDMRL